LTPLSYLPEGNEEELLWYAKIARVIEFSKYTVRIDDLIKLLWYRIRESKPPSDESIEKKASFSEILKMDETDGVLFSIIKRICEKFTQEPWMLEQKIELIYYAFTRNPSKLDEMKITKPKWEDTTLRQRLSDIYNSK
jgi:hypothetical protein